MQHLWTCNSTRILLQRQIVLSITQPSGQILRWFKLGWKENEIYFPTKKESSNLESYERVLGVLSQVCLCSLNPNPERERFGLYLLLAQKWHERTFWTAPKLILFPYLHMWIVQMCMYAIFLVVSKVVMSSSSSPFWKQSRPLHCLHRFSGCSDTTW